MSYLQTLNVKQMGEALLGAAEKMVPVTFTVRQDNAWTNFYSRFLAIRGVQMCFEPPYRTDGGAPHEFVPSESVGIGFKFKHHKHMLSTIVVGLDNIALNEGEKVPVLAVECPSTMERLRRRVYVRAAVPANRIVRASFWLGGYESEPAGTSPGRPVASGKVMDISAGGLQVLSTQDAGMVLDVGDVIGLRITFGSDDEVVYADAQFRHAMQADDGIMLGFQFIGLGQSPEGKSALQIISSKVTEFQKMAQQAGVIDTFE